MKKGKGYRTIPLNINRKMVIASVRSNKRSAIHCISEVDISVPRAIRKEIFETTGEKISFTAYIVRCLAETIKHVPEMNSFIKGNRIVLLDDINISVLVERNLNGESIPEPLGIKNLESKSTLQVHNEIRAAQANTGQKLGSLTNSLWIRFIPSFLFRHFIKIADQNIALAKKYGKVAVTAVGMHSQFPLWFIPHGTATVLVTVGSLNRKVIETANGYESREHLCLTVSFDHEIIDGAPATRFMNRFCSVLSNGELMKVTNNAN